MKPSRLLIAYAIIISLCVNGTLPPDANMLIACGVFLLYSLVMPIIFLPIDNESNSLKYLGAWVVMFIMLNCYMDYAKS